MEKIEKLKQHFKKELIDGYLIPKNDQFFGEYVSKYNDRLNYITNFSGSYGLCLILKKNNYANVWKWQEFSFKENIYSTMNDLIDPLKEIYEKNNEFNYKTF